MDVITLSLVAHTNVGKTTLARTLLGRDVGEVRDAAHVTDTAERYLLLGPVEGTTLMLWDTPGFGDSVRLARRLRQGGGALAAFLAAVWDRWTDRAFWSSQQVLRHLREAGEIVLYLVDAAAAPDGPDVAAELELLDWVGKPVIVLLNQLGAPPPPEAEAAELARWRAALAPRERVHAVLPLDAFARCWVQEGVLLEAVRAALAPARRAAMDRLADAWRARAHERFTDAVWVLAEDLALAARAREPLRGGEGVAGLVARATGSGAAARALADARARLGRSLEARVRESTTRLISLHGLDGSAGDALLAGIDRRVVARWRVDETGSALAGGVLAGALAGLKADLASGGLTLGGGLIVGGLLGALGGGGGARLVNRLRGRRSSTVGWDAAVLEALYADALLRYLAVAHYGRGRGPWQEDPRPRHWADLVEARTSARRAELATLHAMGVADAGQAPAREAALRAGFAAMLAADLGALLGALYPAARAQLPTTGAARSAPSS